MLKSFFLNVVFIGGVFVVNCFTQAQPRSVDKPRTQPSNIIEDLGKMSAASRNADYQPRESFSVRKTVSRKQKKRLLPDRSLLIRYADFLEQPNTGLIRLFPDIGCEKNDNLLVVSEECLNWIPMSGFYSFREEEYTRDFLSDIRLKNNTLITEGILEQGLLVALGDIELDKINLKTAGISFLNDYKPETESSKVIEQLRHLARGIKSGEHLYRRSLPALENVTYGLRVIAYEGNFSSVFRGQRFNVLAGDERVDMTLIFRVIKKEETGTLTIVWKELARKDAPKIIFLKRKRNRFI